MEVRDPRSPAGELVAPAAELFTLLDGGGRIVYVSPDPELLVGYTAEELLGTRYHDHVHPDDTLCEAAASGANGLARTRLRHKDGHWLTVEGWASGAVRDADGETTITFTAARDAEAHARAASTLGAGDRIVCAIFEGALDAMLLADDDRRYVDANPTACALLGLPRDELIGRRVEEFADESTRHLVAGQWSAFIELGATAGNFEGATLDGRRFSADFKAIANVLPGLHLSVLRDVTDRTRAEEELRKSEQLYRAIVETAQEGIWVLDVDGVTTFANAAMCEMLACRPGELVGRPVTDFARRGGARLVVELLDRSPERRTEPFQWEFQRADGKPLHAQMRADPLYAADGTYCGALATVTDTGEARRRADRQRIVAELGRTALTGETVDALMLAAARGVADAFDADVAGVLELLPDGDLLIRADDGWEEAVGTRVTAEYQAGYFLGSGERLMVVEDASTDPRFVTAPDLVARGVTSSLMCAIDFEGETFGLIDAHTRRRRTFDEGEKSFLESVANLIASAIHRERVTEALQESEERFRRLADNAQDIVYRWRLGDDPGYEYVNASASLTGYSPEEFLADPGLVNRITHPDYRDQLAQNAGETVSDGVIQMIHQDGSPIWFDCRNRVVYDADGAAVAVEGISRDVTARVEAELGREALEEQLRQSHKMEAVGRLAGGVAHDMNNLLTAISGYAELLGESEGRPAADVRHAEEIKRAADRAARLTQQLLAFGRQQVLRLQPLDPSDLVRACEDKLRQTAGEAVTLTTFVSAEAASVQTDRRLLEQVLLELTLNARAAMPDGGTLTIATSQLVLDRELVAPNGIVAPGSYTQIAVTDTGVGMDPETVGRVFEPFFTTHAPGDGVGLGLSTVYGIVTQTGGHVWARSEPGEGTTVTIVLPHSLDVAAEPPPPEIGVAPASRNETVLLVEDEEIVRDLITEMLSEAGYRVVVAQNGEEAVTAFDEGGPVDIVLTDVVMPKMGGPALVGVLRGRDPALRVLYASGYTDDPRITEGTQDGFLQKPFSRAELLHQLRTLLDVPAA